MSLIGNASYLDDSINTDAVAAISILSSLLSLIGSGSVLVFSIHHRCILYPEIFPTFHLAVADFLASLSLIVSSVIFLTGTPGSSGLRMACAVFSGLITSFYTTTFFLIVVYTLETLFRFRRRLNEGTSLNSLSIACNCQMNLVYTFSWLVPMILSVVLIFKTYSEDEQLQNIRMCSLCFAVFRFDEDACWKGESAVTIQHMAKLTFLIPLVLVMMINMILYVLIWRTYRQVAIRSGLLSYHQRREERLLRRKTCFYQAVFLVCWLPSIVVGCSSFHNNYSMSSFYPGLLIQVVLGPLQGLLNSVIYGWKRDSFRKVLTERSSLLSTNRTTMIYSRNHGSAPGDQISPWTIDAGGKT